MQNPALVSLFAVIVPLANAFIIDFNAADHCVGSTVGTFVGSLGTGCQTQINNATDSTELINAPGGSFNVIAHPDHSKDDQTAVAFYSNPDCTLLIGFSNVPSCVGAGAYRSYEIIQLSDAWAGEYNLQPPQIVSQKPNATATRTSGHVLPTGYVSASSSHISFHFSSTPHKTSSTLRPKPHIKSSITSISTSTNSHKTPKTKHTTFAKHSLLQNRRANLLVHDSDPLEVGHYASGPAPTHGAVRRTTSGISKFHQVAARAWQGIPTSEWSDDLQVRSSSVSPSTLIANSPLHHRSTPPQTCNFIRSCMIDAAPDSRFGLRAAGPALLDTVKTLNPAGDHWTFLQRALVVEVVQGNKTAGFVYAQTQLHNEDVAGCSRKGTQADALVEALEIGVDGERGVTDLRVDLKGENGEVGTDSLFVSVKAADSRTEGRISPICEAVEVNF